LHLRKLKGELGTNLPSLSRAKLTQLIEEAVVDANVEKVDMTLDGHIVAICRRGKTRQKIPILDLPLPTPTPAGVEWIAAYRHWRRGSW
jgi:hypothetical protein